RKSLLAQYELENQSTTIVAIDAHGERVATADLPNGVVVMRSVATGAELARLEDDDDQIRAMAFSPDGKRFVKSDPGETVLYRLQPLTRIAGIGTDADCLEFSPDGNVVAACTTDGLRLWTMSSAAWRDLARRIAGRTLTPAERIEY